MKDTDFVSRRSLLAAGVAASTAFAGCTGSEDPESSDSPDSETDPSTEDSSETQKPSLAEFSYPDGASQDGIDRDALYNAHESALTDAGSLTFSIERTSIHGEHEFSTVATNEYASGAISREVEDDGVTTSVWSPSTEEKAYVQLTSGFETAHRIDSAPDASEVTGLRRVESVLMRVDWGEAKEVVETADGFGVTYEAVGANQDRLPDEVQIEDVSATVTVTEAGYVSELSNEYTEVLGSDKFREDITLSIEAVGDTTVEKPEWADTAMEEGIQFSVTPTDDNTAVAVEMVNGTEIPSEARVTLSSGQHRGTATLPSSLSTGDRLYLGLSDTGELLITEDSTPTNTVELDFFVRTTIRDSGFLLLEHEMQL